jgi:hypothetical protein
LNLNLLIKSFIKVIVQFAITIESHSKMK